MGTRERGDDDPAADAAPELIRPEDFLPRDRLPEDARRLGFDRWSAAELAFASALDGRKRSHRIFAYVMLGFFLFPVAATLQFLLR